MEIFSHRFVALVAVVAVDAPENACKKKRSQSCDLRIDESIGFVSICCDLSQESWNFADLHPIWFPRPIPGDRRFFVHGSLAICCRCWVCFSWHK